MVLFVFHSGIMSDPLLSVVYFLCIFLFLYIKFVLLYEGDFQSAVITSAKVAMFPSLYNCAMACLSLGSITQRSTNGFR